MSGLAEQELDRSPARLWAGRIALVVGIAAVLGLMAWLLSGVSAKSSTPKKQTVSIKVLPDTPPPPPPPPKDDKPPPPQEPKQTMQMEAPKVQAPQEAPAALKMEGPAGDGPSAFAGGAITKDYVGGPTGTGSGTQSNRAQFQFFFNSARQQLKDEIERHLKTDSPELTAVFSIWLDSSGAIKRFAVDSSGNAETDAQIKAALDETARSLRLQPPPDLPQPMKFRVSLRPLG